ncbi:MAG: hypothetical protein K2Q01_06280, partial [Rickettsiales bacterium]|nr:hypothetical protein [Rickettsiales bacterium]
ALCPLTGRIVYRGVRGRQAPLRLAGLEKPGPRVGIFLSGSANVQALTEAIQSLLVLSPEYVLVRGHPVDFANPDFANIAAISPKVRISSGTTLEEDVRVCDMVVAGNTNAILESLRMGTPVMYHAKLDPIPYDYNGFVAGGLVPDVVDMRMLDVRQMLAFYTAQWEARMRYFDAGYGQDEEVLRQNVRREIRDALGVA